MEGVVYVIVFHQGNDIVALPIYSQNDPTPPNAIDIICILNEREVAGGKKIAGTKIDKSQLLRIER